MEVSNMTDQATAATVERAVGLAGKYLTFVLADEEYGLEILKVREIMGVMDITAVPRTPDFVKGVINLRGKVIPVIDLRLKFDMPEAERTEETCIIVVNVGDVEMGIIVDKVSEVQDIAESDIEDSPAFGASVDTDFILGMGKADDKVTILLDIAKVLGGRELSAVKEVIERDSQSDSESE
jgi:purine-binding chemotaxis protein CheW